MQVSPPIAVLAIMAVLVAAARGGAGKRGTTHRHAPKTRTVGERACRRGRTTTNDRAGDRGACGQLGRRRSGLGELARKVQKINVQWLGPGDVTKRTTQTNPDIQRFDEHCKIDAKPWTLPTRVSRDRKHRYRSAAKS